MADLIDRQEAIRIASGYCHPANVVKELAKLPSAQPDKVYEQGWKDGQDALREEIWERERDRLD